MPKKKIREAVILFLLETLPGECKEVLLTFRQMLQESQKEEKLKAEIRLYCYICMLTEIKIINEEEAGQLTGYFIPDF